MSKRISQIASLVLFSMLFVAGCGKDPGPPPPLAVEQIPAELDKGFKAAKQEAKDLVTRINSSLQTKDYATAYDDVQALGNIPEASVEQRRLTARATLAIHSLLISAQAQGDPNAAAALKYHQLTK